MANIRKLHQRRGAKRLWFAGRRATEAQSFARVRRQIRRAELRHKRLSLMASQHCRIAAAEPLRKGRVLSSLLAAGRREVQWSVGAELAKGATDLRFPPAPEPRNWDELDDLAYSITPESRHSPALDDWEPPRVELPLKPVDLDD